MNDLDYLLLQDGTIHLVMGPHHPQGFLRTLPVYWPDPDGERFNQELGRMKKIVAEPNPELAKTYRYYQHSFRPTFATIVPVNVVKKVYQPRVAFQRFLTSEPVNSIWRNLAESLLKMGLKSNDIGIFGSTLVGLDKIDAHRQKDIDFLLYGQESCRLVRLKINRLRSLTSAKPLSAAHRRYQTNKYARNLTNNVNNFDFTLKNKWSSLEFAPGLVSTLRFVYKENEIPDNPLATPIMAETTVEGPVVDDFGANFMPRTFSLRTASGRLVKVASYFWAHQACVKVGDQVIVRGSLHQNNTVTISRPDHGIKPINPIASEREN